jgi:predicted MPP superfamily phosphohydrolase
MIKLALCSDIHLNFLTIERVEAFACGIFDADVDGVLITGDISTALTLTAHLKMLVAIIEKPIYFVLGNHDYWGSHFGRVMNEMVDLMKDEPLLHWLSESDPIALTNQTALVGVDGWYDMGHGDAHNSSTLMNDWFKISNFFVAAAPMMHVSEPKISRDVIVSISRQKAQQDAAHADNLLHEAFSKHDHVIFATHVPPWHHIARYNGRPTEIDMLPYYTSKVMGDMLEAIAKNLPHGKTLTVFCGHTHNPASAQILPNLSAYCTGAKYYSPMISRIVDVL